MLEKYFWYLLLIIIVIAKWRIVIKMFKDIFEKYAFSKKRGLCLSCKWFKKKESVNFCSHPGIKTEVYPDDQIDECEHWEVWKKGKKDKEEILNNKRGDEK